MVASGRLRGDFASLPRVARALGAVMPDEAIEHRRRRGNRLNIRSRRVVLPPILAPTGTHVTAGARSRDELVGVERILFDGLHAAGMVAAAAPSGATNAVPLAVRNIVATADLGETQRLHAVGLGLGRDAVEYEPETFPGLVYRPPGIRGAVLIFSSGKIVMTGLRDETELSVLVEVLRCAVALGGGPPSSEVGRAR